MTSHQNYASVHRGLPKIINENKKNRSRSSATYEEAVDWITRHSHVIIKCMDYIKTFPLIIGENNLDFLRNFPRSTISENSVFCKRPAFVDKEVNGKHFSPTVQSIDKTRSFSVSSRHVYVCTDSCDTTLSEYVADEIVGCLIPHVYVRISNLCRNDMRNSHERIGKNNAMIFFLSDVSLSNLNCVSQLELARKNNVKIIFVKSRGYELCPFLPVTLNKNHRQLLTEFVANGAKTSLVYTSEIDDRFMTELYRKLSIQVDTASHPTRVSVYGSKKGLNESSYNKLFTVDSSKVDDFKHLQNRSNQDTRRGHVKRGSTSDLSKGTPSILPHPTLRTSLSLGSRLDEAQQQQTTYLVCSGNGVMRIVHWPPDPDESRSHDGIYDPPFHSPDSMIDFN